MLWAVIILWIVLTGGLCGLAFLLLVGGAIARRERPTSKRFAAIILGPGIKLGGGNLIVTLVASWIVWALVGVLVIVLLMKQPS